MNHRRRLVIALGTVAFTVPLFSFAQQQAAKDYPSRPIRLVVPYTPGGGVDFIGHVLGQRIAPVIGQNLFLDNRGGAGGVIGTDAVAKSPPDGYTILLTSSAHASLPVIYKSLPYDPVKDFTPISLVANSAGFVLVVHPSLPARSVKQLVALAKAQPGKLNYGSSGVGGTLHLATEAFNLMAGTQLAHVPYKGVGPATKGIIDEAGARCAPPPGINEESDLGKREEADCGRNLPMANAKFQPIRSFAQIFSQECLHVFRWNRPAK